MSKGNGLNVVMLDKVRRERLAEEEKAIVLEERALEMLKRARHMLFAAVRANGRMRIARADLDAVDETSRIDVKVQENGDLVLSFLGGE